MRRLVTLALSIMLCFTLCACTGSSDDISENVLDIRAKCIGAESFDMIFKLTAESGDRLYSFKLHYTGTDENGTVEVIEPDNISGLTIKIKDGRAELSYDSIVFDIGKLFGDVASPLEVIPLLIDAWKNERVSSSYAEKDERELLTVMETSVGAESLQKTWFDSELLPVRAEINVDGERVIYCEFEEAKIK